MNINLPALTVTGILCLVALTAIANDQNTSKFTRIQCKSHDEIVSNFTCRVKLVSRYVNLLNISGYLNHQVDSISATIRFHKKLNVYRPFLVDVKEDGCQLFTNKYRVPYLNMLYKIAAPYTNVNHSCPYKKEQELFITNVPMDASKLPSIWPAGEYRADITVIINNNPSASLTVFIYLEIGEKLFG